MGENARGACGLLDFERGGGSEKGRHVLHHSFAQRLHSKTPLVPRFVSELQTMYRRAVPARQARNAFLVDTRLRHNTITTPQRHPRHPDIISSSINLSALYLIDPHPTTTAYRHRPTRPTQSFQAAPGLFSRQGADTPNIH